MAALIKMIGINTGALKMLPWEAVLFTVRSIPQVPAWVDAEPDLFEKYAPAREEMATMIGEDVVTIAQMKAAVLTRDKRKILKKMDKTIVLELEFLENHAEKCLKAKTRINILSLFPMTDEPRSAKEAPYLTCPTTQTTTNFTTPITPHISHNISSPIS